MMHFETYHWEDHVPRKGGWKLNLAVGALAFGLISAALPDSPSDGAPNMSASTKSAAKVSLSALQTERRVEPAAFMGYPGRATQCPAASVDS